MKRFLMIGLLLWVGNSLIPVVSSNNYVNNSHEEIIENTTPIAFPGAEGYGRFVTGGRGGRVIYVTNLNDSGEGSFRQAVMATGPRIVMFKVSGTIELQSHVNLGSSQGDLTIAGQTAPGDGITLRNYRMYIGADNVIIRFLRFRMGDTKEVEDDPLWGRRQQGIIIDHCSLSWGTDETTSFYDNSDFTMQWCIISESLRNSVHDKGSHGYMGIWGGKNASFHHNLLAHHDSRNPRFCGSRYSRQPELEHVDFRNNVIYNWGGNSGYAGEGGTYNMVNNYYKSGPATRSNQNRIFQMYKDDNQEGGVHGVFYSHGNYMHGYPNVTADNWIGMHRTFLADWNDLRSVIEYDKGQISTHSAQDAFEQVLAWAGASLQRDPVDLRVVNETREGTYTFEGSNGSTGGLIDTQNDVGGWPALQSLDPEMDTDGDGIPDWWEVKYGLDPNDPDDGNGYDLHSFYTNVEVYINSLVQHIVDQKMVAGVANYNDLYEVYSGHPELLSQSEVSQIVTAGEPFESILFTWEKAVTVRVDGLPEGVEAEINDEDKTLFISGAALYSGDFEYTVTTIGGITAVSESGVLSVTGGATLIPDESALLVQSVLVDAPIESVTFAFNEATGVIVDDLPEGIILTVDADEQTLLLEGAIGVAGSYELILMTEGGATVAKQTVIINVFAGNAEIIKHGSPSSSQEIKDGEAIGEFYFRWENAIDVVIEGLPEGVVVIKDYNLRRAILRGRPLETGIFDYVVRTIGGVTEDVFEATFTISETTNIVDQPRVDTAVRVYPNPFTDEVNVMAPFAQLITNLKLFTLDGLMIRHEIASGDSHILKLDELRGGVYFLVVEFDSLAPQTIKLLKKKD